MTRLHQVNGHRSAELFLFLTVVVNGHVLIALLLSITVVVRPVPFPQTWSSIFVFTGCAINQPRIDVEGENPNFVMAPLICTPDAKHIVRDFEGTMHVNVTLSLGPRGLINPHTSANSPGTPSGPNSGAGPSGVGKHVLAEASSIVPLGRCPLPDWRRHAAPCQPVL